MDGREYKDGYYIVESHDGIRHILLIDSGLAYFHGDEFADDIESLTEDGWTVIHPEPLPVDGGITYYDNSGNISLIAPNSSLSNHVREYVFTKSN